MYRGGCTEGVSGAREHVGTGLEAESVALLSDSSYYYIYFYVKKGAPRPKGRITYVGTAWPRRVHSRWDESDRENTET